MKIIIIRRLIWINNKRGGLTINQAKQSKARLQNNTFDIAVSNFSLVQIKQSIHGAFDELSLKFSTDRLIPLPINVAKRSVLTVVHVNDDACAGQYDTVVFYHCWREKEKGHGERISQKLLVCKLRSC